ncbi:MAG: HEPN domain-containing protein [Thermodesulfobacteriota bacterium]
MKEDREALARYRMERSFETLEEAKLLFNGKKYVGAINRIYYVMFYAINALLILEGYSSSKHSGVMSLFNRHFIRTGIVSKEAGRFFQEMFVSRSKGDYGDFKTFTKEEAKSGLDKCEKYLQELKEALEKRFEE